MDEGFEQRMVEVHGETGREWLTRLPEIISLCVTAVAMEASVRLCLNPLIIHDVLGQSITYANSAFSLGFRSPRFGTR